ncbi:MAG: G-D-S-L family lipolytic protein [Bacteroidota bacterium]
MKRFIATLASFGLLMVSCSDDDNTPIDSGGSDPDPVEYSNGSADFSNYVAVGNSLTAGFSDGALFAAGQMASFPNMLATSFAEAGGGAFNIPFMADDLGGATLGGEPALENRFILSFASGSPAPARLQGMGTTEIANVLTNGPFNNMGVPGATSFHLLAPGYGNVQGVALGAANPYYARIASSPDATVLGDAAAQGATFFSLWIGNNDILGYATSGGAGIDQLNNLDPSTYGGNDISDPNVVSGSIDAILETMTANGAGGVVANLPDVITIPYFTTVPFAPLDPTNPDFGNLIPGLNMTFGGINQVFDALGVPERKIEFSTSAASALVIRDEDLTDLSQQLTAGLIQGGLDAPTAGVLGFLYGQARQANQDDLVVLPAQNEIAQPNEAALATLLNLGVPEAQAAQLSVNGITYPMEDQWILTPEEQQAVVTATTAYNTAIRALATEYDLAFVDANSYLRTVATEGIPLSDGSIVTAIFATGGGFSLDGVHPSPRGYALLANLFIDAIEEKYDALLPRVDPLEFTGLYIN